MDEKKKEQFIDELFLFVSDIMIGAERGLYKNLYHILKENFKDNHIFAIAFADFYITYFNSAYQALITDGDPYFVEQFGKLHQILSHSYICLLNIVFALTTTTHQSLDRDKFDLSNLDNFTLSIAKEIADKLESQRPMLLSTVNHKCNGEDIKNYDPNEPMFIMRKKM
jgi:hypothetical protein